MQSKLSKNTRNANADERRFHAITKESDCITCGNPGPSIVHHCEGAKWKHNKVLCGHWFVIPLCLTCDDVITKGSRKAFRDRFGSQSALWVEHVNNTNLVEPDDVHRAIVDWNK